MGDLFHMYLCDTNIINKQHRKALALSTSETSEFISEAIPASMAHLQVANLALPDETPVNQAMGLYTDNMDWTIGRYWFPLGLHF